MITEGCGTLAAHNTLSTVVVVQDIIGPLSIAQLSSHCARPDICYQMLAFREREWYRLPLPRVVFAPQNIDIDGTCRSGFMAVLPR